MLIDIVYVLVGFTLLVWAADRFVAGASATARNLGVSPMIVGLTVVGFGTSAPELVTSAVAALEGSPELAVGNAIGSNIANIALILGCTALFRPLTVSSRTLKREYPLLMLVMCLALLLLLDEELDRLDGLALALLLVGLIAWMAFLGIKRADPDPMAQEFAEQIPTDVPTRRALGWIAMGIVILPVSSHILVVGAVDIAWRLGVNESVIGLTIVALGTSLPELAAALASTVKHEHDITIGNIIGSNMFNILGVLGIAGMIAESQLPPFLLVRDYSIMLALSLVLFFMAYGFHGPGRVGRVNGGLLLTAFVGYQLLVYFTELTFGVAAPHAPLP